ncbi:hypothetical protein MRX96_001520 [Rhipicephalus microplus]
MGETKVDLQAFLDTCVAEMTEVGLRFNAMKTKAVLFAGNMAEATDLKLGGESIATDTAYKRTFDNAVLSVLCRACGSAQETIAHIVLECDQIGLPETEPLHTALGFAGEDGVINPQAVKETMRRLECWRAVVVSQRAKALAGAAQ